MAGEEDITRKLLAWRDRSIRSFAVGMKDGAGAIEAEAQATTAYNGMSGATRASTICYTATEGDTATGEVQAAYNAAAGRLQNFTGHAGRPHLGSVPGPGEDEVWDVLTVPTDYIDKLEHDKGGEKAFLWDSLYGNASRVLALVAASWRGAFNG